jgi:hypothetical protein
VGRTVQKVDWPSPDFSLPACNCWGLMGAVIMTTRFSWDREPHQVDCTVAQTWSGPQVSQPRDGMKPISRG